MTPANLTLSTPVVCVAQSKTEADKKQYEMSYTVFNFNYCSGDLELNS